MAQKIWTWYSNTGGSLADGSLWYLTNGSTPGTNYGVPGPGDAAQLLSNGATAAQVVTGGLSVMALTTSTAANFTLAGSGAITAADFTLSGTLTVNGVVTQTDPATALFVYGGKLLLSGGRVTAVGIEEGVNGGGTLQALAGSVITVSGAPNSYAPGGAVGITIKQTGLIDASTVNSAAGFISVGTSGPTATPTLTVQNGSHVQALYTFLGSQGGTGGLLAITGAGTTYADVGPGTANSDSGFMIVGDFDHGYMATAPGPTASLSVTGGATLTEGQGARIGQDALTSGAATVATGGLWSIAQSLRVGQNGTGTLTVGAGGTVRSLGPHVLATSSISFGNNAGSVGTGNVGGAGALLDTGGDRLTIGNLGTGTLTVAAGGTVTAGSAYADLEAALSIGGSLGGSGTLYIAGGGTQVLAAGLAVVGGNNIGSGNRAGGTGVVSVVAGGRLNATALALYSGSSIAIDTTSIVDIGGTAGAAGALTLEAGATLFAYGGTVAGTIAGAGTVRIAGALTVGTTTAGLTYSFAAPHSRLTVYGEIGAATIVGFGQGDAIDFGSQTGISVSGGVLRAGNGTFTLTGVAGAQYTIASDGAGGTLVTARSATQDFNGDGKSDLLVQQANGQGIIYTDNGLSVSSGVLLGNPGPSWHLLGSADFNGDGQPDLLYQNDNGSLVDFVMRGTSIVSGFNLGTPGSSWHYRGAADFNADGKADVLLQNDNGALVVLETNGTSLIGSALVATLPAGAAVEGVADFDGDGNPDILVQTSDGSLVDFVMNGTTVVAATLIGNPGAGYSIGGTGDYNNDGKADILLHNDNGVNIVWEMNGPVVTAGVFVGNPGANDAAAVAGVDLDGDGNADLVVQDRTTSTLIGYTTNGAGGLTAGAVLGTPGIGTNVVGGNPITFLDGTGAAPVLAGTPGPDQFVFTSYTGGLHTITNFDPAQDSVALSLAAFPTYAAVQANEASYNGGTFINLGGTAALIIQGVAPGQLNIGNFVLR